MSAQTSRKSLDTVLEEAAASYQQANIVNHCPVCSKSCCRLETQVLEMNWKQVKVLWKIEEARAVFDQKLASGQGPQEIRAGDGLYFAHKKTCPAYDEKHRTCQVYDQPQIKPRGCTDYPVYGDGDCLTADLRCEAVDIEALLAWLARAVGPEYRIIQSADRDFPFLISLVVKRIAAKGKGRERRGGR